jgi:glycoside/pentoside/hexuronide:cation symporter, GPH family
MSQRDAPRPPAVPASCSLSSMLIYGSGECASSLVMNSIFGFAMLYYTKALGLNPVWAGIAMSVSVFWEAITEPVMGHISDNTRSRWGRRHPYMIVGGLLMAVCSYLIWTVPAAFRASQVTIFWYLVIVNLVLRAGLTLFCIPYLALGFEMCADYQGRSRLQGIRQVFNMAANLAGPALAWSIFFRDRNGVHGTTVAANYLHMGTVFAVATILFVLLAVGGTSRWSKDTRQEPNAGEESRFATNMKHILSDTNIRWLVIFVLVIGTGTLWMSSLQVFVYDDFMKLSAGEKTFAHSSTMVGWAVGSFISVRLARRLDKKGTVVVGGLISSGANLILALAFLSGIMHPGTVWKLSGITLPTALCVFVVFHAGYWLGIGMMMPIATAMIADLSEIHRLQTGCEKDASYASVFSLANRLACSVGMITSGFGLNLIGYRATTGEGATSQTIWRLGFASFVIGAAMCLVALLPILKYSVTRNRLEAMRSVPPLVPTVVQ